MNNYLGSQNKMTDNQNLNNLNNNLNNKFNNLNNVNSLEKENEIILEDSTEVDSLTEIFNIIKSELDLIGNITYYP